VYYHPGVPNLLSLGQLQSEEAKQQGVSVDFVRGSFVVSKGDEEYVFEKNERNLYVCDCTDDVELMATAYNFETVKGNERLYTKKQVEAARRVRQYASAMGAMSMANLIAQVRSRRVEGIDFTVEDVTRAFDIDGPDLQAVRGKSVKKKRAKAPEPVAGKIVNERVSLHVDLMFLSGVVFLVGYVKPLGVLLCNWIKSRKTADVKRGLDKQISKLRSNEFEVVEITSDTEGAIVSMQEELENAGAHVEIHGPNTDSAEVDVKIKQLKNVTRSITVLPYLLPFALLMYAVMYACSKINMWPNSSQAHGYSPMEMFLGRSVSLERDLGARKGSGPMPFGSRCEIFEGTDY
jgi:hypothetical protein